MNKPKKGYEGLTPPHRPYRGGKALVELTQAVLYESGRHPIGTQLMAERISTNSIERTIARYPRNDSIYPSLGLKLSRNEFRLCEYDFVTEYGLLVTVHDGTVSDGDVFRQHVRFRVISRTLKYEVEAASRMNRDSKDTKFKAYVGFGTRGVVKASEAMLMATVIAEAVKLAELESIYQNYRLSEPPAKHRRKSVRAKHT